ncbi:MAG TPA: DNA-3-methyladenine glycosylase 2 family protein [Acidimicrobiales bacterium]|nr:DNA-3-methyladenine glycosylase 2 family protein [Acidimicrobiales bacterium]
MARARRRPAATVAASEHLGRADAVLAQVIAAHPGFDPRAWLDDLPPMDPFGALVFQVVGQQLSVASTRRILERLCVPFAGHLPTARQLLDADPSTLRAAGLSARKVDTLRALAEAFDRGDVSDAALGAMSDEEIEHRLTAIPGIGPWTVHGMLIIALDRPDVVLPGDLALRRAIQRVYGLDAPPSPDEVLAMAERWRPHRSLATAYLFQAAFEEPGT